MRIAPLDGYRSPLRPSPCLIKGVVVVVSGGGGNGAAVRHDITPAFILQLQHSTATPRALLHDDGILESHDNCTRG